MTTYGIGEFRMRNGDKAIVEHKDGYGTRCLVGTVCGHPRSWRITGHYLPDNESPFDLVASWEEPAPDPIDTEMQAWLAEVEAGLGGTTPGDWKLCPHLASPEGDRNCSCGYRGGIWSGDEAYIVVEMGSSPDLDGGRIVGHMIPQADRPTQLADAAHIARTNPKRMAELIGWLKSKGVMK